MLKAFHDFFYFGNVKTYVVVVVESYFFQHSPLIFDAAVSADDVC